MNIKNHIPTLFIFDQPQSCPLEMNLTVILVNHHHVVHSPNVATLTDHHLVHACQPTLDLLQTVVQSAL